MSQQPKRTTKHPNQSTLGIHVSLWKAYLPCQVDHHHHRHHISVKFSLHNGIPADDPFLYRLYPTYANVIEDMTILHITNAKRWLNDPIQWWCQTTLFINNIPSHLMRKSCYKWMQQKGKCEQIVLHSSARHYQNMGELTLPHMDWQVACRSCFSATTG